MNKFIKEKFDKIISVFILLQPLLDLLTGLCINLLSIHITVGIIIRMLFLAFVIYTTVVVYKKKSSLAVYLSLLAYSILYLVGIVFYKNGGLFTELQGLLKVLYFPVILLSLYNLREEFRISIMTLFATLLIYLLLILIPNMLGIGFESYEIAKSGNLGFFNAANEISAIISLLTPLMFIIVKELKNKVLKISFILIYLIVILSIGTKTPLLSLLITAGLAILYYLVIWLRQKVYKKIIYTLLISIFAFASLLLIIPKTTFYKNIKIHLDYLEVDSIVDVIKDKSLIDHFIFSQRLTFLENKALLYADASLYENLFGIGYTENSEATKLIEMDYFDILYSHGIIGFTLIFSIYGLILYQIMKDQNQKSFKNYMLKVSVFLIIILALLTGHIITSPAVSLIAIFLILELQPRRKKDLLFTTVNFEMGGIETSLISLLNQFDYHKYNITVVLEKKEGILLSNVNKNVHLKEVKVSTNPNLILRKIINFWRKLLFTIFNYKKFDSSSCYATYSFSCNKLAKIASNNTSFFIHSDYTLLYKDENEFYKFFNTRKIEDYHKIIFVTNEAKANFIKRYKHLKDKCEVYATFAEVDVILKKSQEKIAAKKPRGKKLLVFVGRLEDHSKKVSRAINLVKEIDNLALWIVGDGPDRKMYEDLVKKYNLGNNITFFGMQKNPYPYIAKADYIILTSDYEGFALIYQEAIILNKEIIGTVDVSDSQMNIGKDFAFIVSKDEKKMVSEVKKILKSKGKMKQIDYKEIQRKRFESLEKIFNEVVV